MDGKFVQMKCFVFSFSNSLRPLVSTLILFQMNKYLFYAESRQLDSLYMSFTTYVPVRQIQE